MSDSKDVKVSRAELTHGYENIDEYRKETLANINEHMKDAPAAIYFGANEDGTYEMYCFGPVPEIAMAIRVGTHYFNKVAADMMISERTDKGPVN